MSQKKLSCPSHVLRKKINNFGFVTNRTQAWISLNKVIKVESEKKSEKNIQLVTHD